MKKMILIVLLVLGSGLNLSADYVAGTSSCKHISRSGNTVFIVRGTGEDFSLGSDDWKKRAMADFLNAEYAVEIDKYCSHHTLNGLSASIYSDSSKSKVNKHFSKLIKRSNKSYNKKIFIIKSGYNELDWK